MAKKRVRERPDFDPPKKARVSFREIFAVMLVLPLFGFIGWQMLEQRRESEEERAAAAAASRPIEDTPRPAPTVAVATPPTDPRTVVAAGANAVVTPAEGLVNADELRRRVALGARGTYIDEILLVSDSGLAHWPERVLNPLRVWVANGSGIAGWNPKYADRVREAFATWSLAGVPVKFTFVRDSADADVLVQWVEKFDVPITGRTIWSRDKNWWIVSGSITLALHHSTGEDLDDRAINAIALHEAGHLLGLNHTADTTNIMTSRVRVHELSGMDRATIRLLYALPPGSIKN